MIEGLNLLEEAIDHFNHGAKSVRAYSNDTTYIITRTGDAAEYQVTVEDVGFTKTKTSSLDEYFLDVFGIEAKY